MTTSTRTTTIPATLQAIPQWCVWGYNEDRSKKIPYCTTGIPARPNEASDFTTYDAVEAYRAAHPDRYNGIGFLFTAQDGLAGIDLDGCRNPQTGHMDPWAWEIIDRLHSYTEVSPSGTGVKIFVRGAVPKSLKFTLGPGAYGKAAAVEVYDRAHYFTVTGRHVQDTPLDVEDRQEALRELYADLQALHALGKQNKAASALIGGDTSAYGGNESDADFALINFLRTPCHRDADTIERVLKLTRLHRAKWDEPRGDATWLQYSIDRALATSPVASTGGVGLRRLSDVQTRPVCWLWKPYIPRGYLVSLEGDGGTGKSTLAALIAARLSRGVHPYTGEPTGAPETVLMLSSEEALEEVLSPKLDALGADRERIWAGSIPTADDLKQWRKMLQDFTPALIVIDPLQEAFGGKVNTNAANQTRAALAPLTELAREFRCTFLCIQHFGKGADDRPKAQHRAIGSVDIDAAMRSVLQIDPDLTTPHQFCIAHVKHNLGPQGGGLVYRTVEIPLGDGNEIVKVEWVEDFGTGKLAEAKRVTLRALAGGSMSRNDLVLVWMQNHVSETTGNRALKELGIRADTDGYYHSP